MVIEHPDRGGSAQTGGIGEHVQQQAVDECGGHGGYRLRVEVAGCLACKVSMPSECPRSTRPTSASWRMCRGRGKSQGRRVSSCPPDDRRLIEKGSNT